MDDSITTDTDDTAGHVLHGEAAKDPVSGGKAPGARARVVGEDDDTEGHMPRKNVVDEPEDDTEGHLRVRASKSVTDEPEDDTEGHLRR